MTEIKKNNVKPLQVTGNQTLDTRDLINEEIFEAGTWTSAQGRTRTYTVEDLKDMARAAGELGARLRIPVKLGHNATQAALFADGMPAAGWVRNLRVRGDKLVADILRVPRKIYDLIRAGAYTAKSLEVRHGYRDETTGRMYQHAPVGLALLGAELPALSGLNPLLNLYEHHGAPPEADIYFFTQNGGDPPVNQDETNQAADDGARIAALEAELAQAQAANQELSQSLSLLEQEKQALEQKVAELEAAMAGASEAEIDVFLNQNARRIPPVLRDHFKALLRGADAQPENYSLRIGDNEIRGRAAVRDYIAGLPEHPMLQEYGRVRDEDNAVEDPDERRIRAYCKEQGLNVENSDHYRRAVNALNISN